MNGGRLDGRKVLHDGNELRPAELDAVLADSYGVSAPFRTSDQDRLTIPLAGCVLVATRS